MMEIHSQKTWYCTALDRGKRPKWDNVMLNPNIEIRNPKQIQMTKQKMTETPPQDSAF